MRATTINRNREKGFTLVELIIATAVLLFGVVAVMDLVPRAMQTNLRNRYDTTSSVVVQRLQELFARQALNDDFVVDPTGLLQQCAVTGVCRFGDRNQSDRIIGARLREVRAPNGARQDVQIDFTAPAVQGYSATYLDPNDPTGMPYEVRWNVITVVRNVGALQNMVIGKRVIVGARRAGDRGQSVSFSTVISR